MYAGVLALFAVADVIEGVYMCRCTCVSVLALFAALVVLTKVRECVC